MRYCDICRGSGQIRLPLYRRMSVQSLVRDTDSVLALGETSRYYPCPECSDSVPQERLSVLQFHALVDTRIDDPRYVNAAKEGAARHLVHELLQGGFISFERGPDDEMNLTYTMRATIGAVHPAHVATLADRIAERQAEVADKLVAEASRNIEHWGSFYSGRDGNISKAQAVASVHDALKTVVGQYAVIPRKIHGH